MTVLTRGSIEDETKKTWADPRLAAETAVLMGAAMRGEFAVRFGDIFQPICCIPRDELVEIARRLDHAMQRRTDAAKARALGRLGVKVANRYIAAGEWTIDERAGEPPVAGLARMIFAMADRCHYRDTHSYEPKGNSALTFGYCLGAAKQFLKHGVAPTRQAVVAMAHTAMKDHHCGVSITDVDTAFRAATTALPLRAWLAVLDDEAPTDSECGP